MDYLFIEYPSCSTCRKAKKFLQEANVAFVDRHIVEDTPSVEELKAWVSSSGIAIHRLFNTSGQVYRQLQLKDKLEQMSDEEKLTLLAGNGMLIKRPLLIHGNQLLTGFKLAEWQKEIE